MSLSMDKRGLHLVDIVSEHSMQLPLVVKVLQGYYGASSQLAPGDKYALHCVKRSKVVQIKDEREKSLIVPLNSAFLFGVTYEGSLDATEGSKFSSVSEILALDVLPKVLCVTKVPTQQNIAALLQVNEVLVVQGVKLEGSRKFLITCSTLSKSTKFLTADTLADFSTKPFLVRLYLPEIIQHFSDQFPCHAFVFQPEAESHVSSLSRRMIESLHEKLVVLKEQHIEVSLIASELRATGTDGSGYSRRSRPIDIPVERNMAEVEVEIITSSEIESIRENTKLIVAKFQSQDIKSLEEVGGGVSAKLQRALYRTKRKDKEQGMGISLESSFGLTSFVPEDSSVTPLYESIPGDSATLYEPLDSVQDKSPDLFHQSVHSDQDGATVKLISPLTSVVSLPPSVPPRRFSKSPSKKPQHTHSTDLRSKLQHSNAPPIATKPKRHDSSVSSDPIQKPRATYQPLEYRELALPTSQQQYIALSKTRSSGEGKLEDATSGHNKTADKQTTASIETKSGSGRSTTTYQQLEFPASQHQYMVLRMNKSDDRSKSEDPTTVQNKLKARETSSDAASGSARPKATHQQLEHSAGQHQCETDEFMPDATFAATDRQATGNVTSTDGTLGSSVTSSDHSVSISDEITEINVTISALGKRLIEVENKLDVLCSKQINRSLDKEDEAEKNKQLLRTLTALQVQQLLDGMNLPQYRDAFIRECVDGGLLVELDESMLEEDLGITSRIHQLRVMRLVKGGTSAISILESANSGTN